jgi:MFS transporter, PAT family, beta-lactamase induction signal transducer AmpG
MLKLAKYFVPTLYFIEGLPYTIINVTSVVALKSLGASNEFIGLSSFLALPWMLKFIWAPLVDAIAIKKKWVISTQFSVSALLILLALSINLAAPIPAFTVVLILLAVVAATQDVAIDGYYLEVLNLQQQAFYVGIRNTFYRLSMLFAGGLLVYIAGKISGLLGVGMAWGCAFVIAAVLVGVAGVFHLSVLPEDVKPISVSAAAKNYATFLPALRDYLDQPKIIAIVIYILTFRLGDALMLKMAQPFLLDARWHGGLGMSISDVGIIYGTIGTIALLGGGIASSCLIARDGLKRWLLPFALIQNLSIPLYWYLAITQPGTVAVAVVNFIEQAAYGMGVTAFTVFILQTVKPKHKAAHYAIATALMAAGMLLPSAASGILQVKLGYAGLFLLSTFAAIPGIISIFFLPLTEKQAAA